MSNVASKSELFREIALAHIHGEVTIDEMREICEEHGYWTQEDDADVLRRQRNAEIRREARKPIYDDEGNRHEFVNIKRASASPSEKQQFFVFLGEVTQEDFEWLISDRISKSKYFADEAKRYLDVFGERFGKKEKAKLQRRLNLNFD